MNSLPEKLGSAITNCGLRGSRILVGVSGGADSVALLRGLRELQDEQQIEIIAAHLNHQLRGEQSGDDATWVEALCAKLGVGLILEGRNIADIAEQRGHGLEETARQQRYEFLSLAAEREGCSHVAVAHTADDQAETILHHVLRGTGIAGLSGMSMMRPLGDALQLVRPLLDVSRVDVETYLLGIGQSFRTDDSASEQSFTRNRIRHSLLPSLKRDFNPQVEQALLRLGRLAGDVRVMTEELAGRLLDSALIEKNEMTCRIDCAQLIDKPVHLVRECFSLLWKRQNWPRKRMGFADWNRLATMTRADQTDGSADTLPGHIEAARRGSLLVLRRMG
ncbi:MAG: tRNA lysidine(34) synthetase TilS [Planctomycetaceae bacterium]|nr:tRNA lysidine(34) synthetase TilS [Planctomycetaceae bacterium]